MLERGDREGQIVWIAHSASDRRVAGTAGRCPALTRLAVPQAVSTRDRFCSVLAPHMYAET
jgi:hypothetical protein